MKKRIFAFLTAAMCFASVMSVNAVAKINIVYSQEAVTSLREANVQFETSYNARPTIEIDLYEGEQVQLVLPDDPDRTEINYVNFSSDECRTAVSYDLKLTGYRKGEDTVKIYIGYKGKEEENYILLKVNITENDMISSENRAKIEKLSEYKGDRGAGFLRKKLELAGVVDKNAPRITLDKAKEIIRSAEDFMDIVMQFNRIHGYPDNYYESGDYGYIYWLDENGNEYITLSEQNMVLYGKIADDGTEQQFHMLYPTEEVTELIDNDKKEKNYYYALYNQLKPEEQASEAANKASLTVEESEMTTLDDASVPTTITTAKVTTTTAQQTTVTTTRNHPDLKLNVTIIEISEDMLFLVPDEDVSWNTPKKFILSAKELDSSIAPALGMKLEVTFNDWFIDTYPAQFTGIQKITVISKAPEILKGDANCDGQLDMADVVLIMQALANPNRYDINGTAFRHLTPQGLINADVDGYGLTVADALSIQKMLLGLEDENSEANSGIVVFEMTPSKIGVDEFLTNNPTIKNSYKDDDLYNITPQKITEKFGFQIFKDQNECETFLVYNGETHQLGKGFGGPGTISFAVADLNGDEHYELYFTYSWGSGLDHPGIDCFDTSSSIKFEGFDQYLSKHCVFAVENGKLGVYKARYTSADFVRIKAEPTEKIGEIIADKETNKVVFRTFKQQ